jgi:two-component system response regulator AtoC
MKKILIIDDDRILCRSMEIRLRELGYDVFFSLNGADGLISACKTNPDYIFLDLRLPDMSGIEILDRLKKETVNCPVIMISGHQDMKATIEAIRLGAIDYIRKPFGMDEILLAIEKWERNKKETAQRGIPLEIEDLKEDVHEIVGRSREIMDVVKRIAILSKNRVPVLIEGESGTGKELVARVLHESSNPDKPFVAVNCSSVVPTLLESEMFGHEKGAFTGADSRKTGKLELADEGTIFLDEIGDLALDMQPKLLRAFQECEFERVGGIVPIALKARVIAATNRDIDKMVKEGAFRQDIFYRLAVSRIKIPPLRERKGDIPLLVRHLLARIGHDFSREINEIDKKALSILENYHWPGNVREMENILTQAVALSTSDVLTEQALESVFSVKQFEESADTDIKPLRLVEKNYIASALTKTGWNISRTSKLLEISPTTLRKKISDYNLTPLT